MERKKIYISLPITGRGQGDVRHHSDVLRTYLSKQGYTPVSPLDNYAGKDPTYSDYLTQDLNLLLGCDGVIFARGWEESMGCNIEHDTVMRFKSFVGRNPHAKDFKVMYELTKD